MRRKPLKWKLDKRGLLLHEVMRAWGGEHRLLRYIAQKTNGEAEFCRQSWQNWRDRCQVPLKHVFIVAKALKVPPHALNYDDVPRVSGKEMEWEDVIAACDFLAPETRKRLEKMS